MASYDKNVDEHIASATKYAERAGVPFIAVVDEFHRSWRNASNFTDMELATYVDLYFFHNYVNRICQYCNACAHLACGVFGLLSIVLSLCVLFRSNEFSKPSWLYHKITSIVESAGMTTSLYLGVSLAFPLGQRTFEQMWVFYSPVLVLKNFSVQMVDTITFLMTLERMVALWLPNYFSLINRNQAVLGLCFLAFLNGLTTIAGWWTFEVFASKDYGATARSSPYATTPTYLAAINVRNILSSVVAYGAIFSTVFVVAGMIRRSRQRRKIASASERAALSQAIQLSLLCLTFSVPMVVSTALYIVQNAWLLGIPSGEAAVKTTYELAMYNLKLLLISKYIGVIFTFVGTIGHGYHFYFYYIFNQVFRDAARKIFGSMCGFKVTPYSHSSNNSVSIDLHILRK